MVEIAALRLSGIQYLRVRYLTGLCGLCPTRDARHLSFPNLVPTSVRSTSVPQHSVVIIQASKAVGRSETAGYFRIKPPAEEGVYWLNSAAGEPLRKYSVVPCPAPCHLGGLPRAERGTARLKARLLWSGMCSYHMALGVTLRQSLREACIVIA